MQLLHLAQSRSGCVEDLANLHMDVRGAVSYRNRSGRHSTSSSSAAPMPVSMTWTGVRAVHADSSTTTFSNTPVNLQSHFNPHTPHTSHTQQPTTHLSVSMTLMQLCAAQPEPSTTTTGLPPARFSWNLPSAAADFRGGRGEKGGKVGPTLAWRTADFALGCSTGKG